MTLRCFYEGETEEAVLIRLKIIPQPEKPKGEKEKKPTKGKDVINDRIKNLVEPLLGVEPVRVLVMRDVDAHVSETPEKSGKVSLTWCETCSRIETFRYVVAR